MSEEIKACECIVVSFEELLNQSFKSLNTGEKVTGIVTAITPTEVQVDVGAKQAAYIKLSELTDDPTAKAEDIVHVGDEIETYIVRVNDVEGYAELSKKRLDSVKSWDDVEAEVRDIIANDYPDAKVYKLSEEEHNKMKEVAQTTIDNWIADHENGQEIYDAVLDLIEQYPA